LSSISIVTSKIYSQDIILELKSSAKLKKDVFDKVGFKKNHLDTISLYKEVVKVSDYLKKSGYFLNVLDSVTTKGKVYTAYFNLGKRVKFVKLDFTNIKRLPRSLTKLKTNKKILKIEELEFYLKKISNNMDNEGKSFSKIYLSETTIYNDTLVAFINIEESEKRKVSDVIIKGYEKFPKSFIKNYYKINEQSIFSNKKLQEISNLSKNLPFIGEVKSPEVLFTKDSTTLYMYLKRKKNNSFDGIINFASKENGGLLLNGNIDLQLNNILNTGENFSLFWNSVAEERQEFKLSTKIPYIFNSKFSPEIAFNIYKQDSSFLNTRFNLKLLYNLGSKSEIGLTYSNETSNKLESELNNIESFNSSFLGIKYLYRISSNDNFYNDRFSISLNPSLGSRNSDNKNDTQFKLQTEIKFLYDFNDRNKIYIRNESGVLKSDNYLTNELYRIGGANSLRGFNEQSIFTENYTYFNIEYRYLTSTNSYLHTITDIGFIQNENSNFLTGLGLGYVFKKEQFIFNIALATNTRENNVSLKESKLILSFKSFF